MIDYRELFSECSLYLEKLANASWKQKVMRGLGNTSKAAGKIIGAIPIVKNGPVDEFLQEKGEKISENAESTKERTIKAFAKLSDPEARIFINKMDDMVRLFAHTTEICFDDRQIYYIAD